MDRPKPPSPTRTLRRAALPGALALTLVCGAVAFAGMDFSTRRVDRERISIGTVEKGTLEIKVRAAGRLLPENVEYIASRVAGRVVQVNVKPGDKVKKGDVLVELANPQLVTSAEEARSALEGARAELDAAEAELRTNLLNHEAALVRARTDLQKAQVQLEAESRLVGEHIVSEIDYRRSQLEVAQLTEILSLEERRVKTVRDNVDVQLSIRRSRVAQLGRALERASSEAANLTLVSGMDGVVQAIEIDVGQQLQPGSPVGRIAQADRLYAELRVPAREAAEVRQDQSVSVDLRSGLVEGIVTRVDPTVTDGTVTVDVALNGKLPAGARPLLPVEATVYLERLPGTLYVSRPSSVRADSAISVYRLDRAGQYATRVALRTGKLSLNHVQVLDGLRAGDRIITSEIDEWQTESRILID